ncbi:MAG: Nudix family hydrolase [Gammaproteobacteria bacterium]
MKTIEVAAGVLQGADGKVLVGERPASKPLAGHLEFPGGKLEPGETPVAALVRELEEELGISFDESRLRPLIRFAHAYPEFDALLHVYRLASWRGKPHAREDQRLSWYSPADLYAAPLLPANRPILNALELPATLLVTPEPLPGESEGFIHCFKQALAKDSPGGAMLRLRDPMLLDALAPTLAATAKASGKILLLNTGAVTAPPSGFAGVHLPAAVLVTLDARPAVAGWIGASVHNVEEAAHARKLGLDYVIVGSVRATSSHPGTPPLGWNGFGKIVAAAGIPAYAIGGMTPADLPKVRAHWGQGIAAIRAFWPQTA